MPPIPGLVHWHHYIARNIKTLKAALTKAARTLDASIQQSTQPAAKLEPILVRNSTGKHPLHPLARIRQSQSRWYSTTRQAVEGSVRHFSSGAAARGGSKYADRTAFPKSRTSAYIAQSSGRAPFASTLRPNLTGGTLNRTAGGYSLGGSGRAGGARSFSHTPAAQAQVVQNVSQAVRAFLIGGQKAQFDGCTARGEKRFKAVSTLQQETGRKMKDLPRATPGSFVQFPLNPTVTALAGMGSVAGFSTTQSTSGQKAAQHLNTEGLLDILSADFSRALKDLAAVLNDLRRLSSLGDLPITYEHNHLRIHFPGCDAETVGRLCEELNITRGTVIQDQNFDAFTGTEIALLFPFAPSNGSCSDADSFYEEASPIFPSKYQAIDIRSLLSPSIEELAYSTQSAQSDSDLEREVQENPWMSSPSGYGSVGSGSGYGSGSGSGSGGDKHSPLEYQGFEGIYRFIEELDSVRR
ncbi:hypothetical protein LTR78_008951 [Recurvomyces mirabilis]|uniref:Casein kinase II beta 2 subunit n=1 Tax=Recurvomyces mirabilis TaxID=574656 RepID=A0AAE0TQ53_9PEZI|nr:hypothetical protein LTR78_008951 [Recurvomyces mirabilis]KAK5159752.1 hypothetical protein LTS14_001857 [Recurvomyces mirabilis]